MNAEDKIQKMLDIIRAGGTIHIATAYRVTNVTPRTRAKFEKAGRAVLKAHKGSMYLASGAKYVCIDYCKFSFTA